jgi:hypothetical protein
VLTLYVIVAALQVGYRLSEQKYVEWTNDRSRNGEQSS